MVKESIINNHAGLHYIKSTRYMLIEVSKYRLRQHFRAVAQWALCMEKERERLVIACDALLMPADITYQ